MSKSPKDRARLKPRDKITVSPGEAAELLGIDRSTFYDRVMPYVRTGHIRSLRIGRRQLIFVDSLLAWAEAQASEQAA